MSDQFVLEQYRTSLTGHCYRMLGSIMDADDAVQETMLRAWRGLDKFAERSSMKTWVHRIATNVCLDQIEHRKTRLRAVDIAPPNSVNDVLKSRLRDEWLEPVPDAAVIPADSDPAEQLLLRESVRLAFVAALQYLPPRQRAVLLLTQVLGWSAAEAAETLEMTVPAVNSALQRARATLAERNVDSSLATRPADEHKELLARYLEAFERYDVPALTKLLHEEVAMSMPPIDFWLRGHDAVQAWFLGHGIGCKGSRTIPVSACGQLAFAQYRDNGATPWALAVLDARDGRVTDMTFFLDVERLFPRFGLPMHLTSGDVEAA